jgi:hypothetical protein
VTGEPVRPRRIRTGHLAGLGRDAGGERHRRPHVLNVQDVHPAAEDTAALQPVQRSGHEGVPGPDGVHGVDVDCGHCDPLTVQRGEHALGASGDDDQTDSAVVPGIACALYRGIGAQLREVLLAEAQDVG